MIIGPDSFISVHDYLARLQGATQGVMLVSQTSQRGPSAVSTGWLITDSLIVLPRYVVSHFSDQNPTFECRQYDPAKQTYVSTAAQLILDDFSPPKYEQLQAASRQTGPARLELQKPALLRLQESRPEAALSLELSHQRESEQLFILQHPRGNPILQLSIGRLAGLAGPILRHTADTMAGSSGSPIFNCEWKVVAMHVGSGPPDPQQQQVNEGLTLAFLLESLRSSSAWEEIARHHKLADLAETQSVSASNSVSSTAMQTDATLAAAAVRWEFSPDALSEEDAKRLRPLVIDPKAKRWTLRATHRERALRAAGSLKVLRRARKTPKLGDDRAGPRQEVIDAILRGSPYDISKIEEDALPYWLQAVRWFAGVVPGLPSAGDISRDLERRRIRSRLQLVAGANFRGRKTQLETLHNWYQDTLAGPLVISGIGGMGKSALVAQFALQLPEETLLFWLDFDRADLTPDDAVSVVDALGHQATVQVEGFESPVFDESTTSDETWKQAAQQFGRELAKIKNRGSLLVLDSFEVAQHVKKHQEIWALLELILAEAPGLRVVVSGRATVCGLTLANREAQPLELEGMDRPDAEQWLRDHVGNSSSEFSKWFAQASTSASSSQRSLADEAVERTLDLCAGVPLRLKLALRWLETGGTADEIPTGLPQTLVEGFLYQRILDRVIDPALMPVARAALVLRRITAEMVADVLGPALPEGLDAEETFSRLAREMAFVEAEGSGASFVEPDPSLEQFILLVRPEVRAATLRLLELDDAEEVRAVDQRAAAWYRRQDVHEEANAAELVYHLLRLGDCHGAEQAWRANEDCLSRLLYAVEEIPENEPAARDWLQSKIQGAAESTAGLKAWEQDALERIKSSLARQLNRAVPRILEERGQRSVASPLVFYDAWTLWRDGELKQARQLLAGASDVGGAIGRDRTLLAAQLALEDGDLAECDRLLAAVEGDEHWQDRPEGDLEALAVRAARVRLTVDLKTELDLWQVLDQVDQDPNLLLELNLAPSDLVLPSLSELFARSIVESSPLSIEVPTVSSELPEFAKALDEARFRRYSYGMSRYLPPLSADVSGEDLPLMHPDVAVESVPLEFEGVQGWESAEKLALKLAILGWRRWRLATTSLFLAKALEQASHPQASGDSLRQAVVATLTAYSLRNESAFQFFVPSNRSMWRNEFDFVDDIWLRTLTPKQLDLALDSLKVEAGSRPLIHELLHQDCPDPLKVLIERLTGATTTFDRS